MFLSVLVNELLCTNLFNPSDWHQTSFQLLGEADLTYLFEKHVELSTLSTPHRVSSQL